MSFRTAFFSYSSYLGNPAPSDVPNGELYHLLITVHGGWPTLCSPALPAGRERRLTLDYTAGCSFLNEGKAMQIGVIAKRVGLSVDAIRFYERNALLPRAPRTEGGFRRYGDGDIDTLGFIRRVQGLGFHARRGPRTH
jgi:hypothetical protein